MRLMTPDTAPTIAAETIEATRTRLEANLPVRRNLPASGRLHIDRQLPFLCVYRRPTEGRVPGTARLVTGLASYLVASGETQLRRSVSQLVGAVTETLIGPFGDFLLLEVWAGRDQKKAPHFRLVVPSGEAFRPLAEFFRSELARVKVGDGRVPVEVSHATRPAPPGMTPLLSASRIASLQCAMVGLEVPPLYVDATTGRTYPEVLRKLRRALTVALQRVFHRFSHEYTTRFPVNHHMLGRRAVVKAVWTVDEQMSLVDEQFDFLLQVTPSNSAQAWETFRDGNFERTPKFRYRPLPFDPVRLKRRLWSIPVERVEDPTLSDLFRQKQDELDRQITLLLDIETRSFVHGAAQIFGGVDEDLLALARAVLQQCPDSALDDSSGGTIDTAEFAALARAELAYYRKQWDGVDATVKVRGDVTRGLMVSKGSLIIGEGTQIARRRVDALLQHEIGTHVLTYYNGKAQPLRQLYAGLAGYDPLQEGLAVLAEYFVGGLTPDRLRLLAARVFAVQTMLQGASFREAFRELTGTFGFDPRQAFTIAMRIYRGGGLTKDASYLRGLAELLSYLGTGKPIEPLFVGKIATEHLPIVRELTLRGVLRDPPLRPRYFEEPAALERLRRVRAGITVLDLLS